MTAASCGRDEIDGRGAFGPGWVGVEVNEQRDALRKDALAQRCVL